MKTVCSGGARIAYDEHGPAAAPPLVLVHSLGLDRTTWAGQIERLAGSFRILCVDLRGHGASSSPPGAYSLADLGRDVLAVIDDAASGERVHLCGLSLGGIVSLGFALDHGDRLRTVTVAASAAKVGTSEIWQARADAVLAGGMAVVRDAVLGRFFSPTFAGIEPGVVARAAATLVGTSPAGYAGCCAALRDADLRGRLGAMTTPLLVVAGGADVACPPERSRELADAVPGSRFVELEGAGHIIPLERQDAFAQRLSGFLGEHIR